MNGSLPEVFPVNFGVFDDQRLVLSHQLGLIYEMTLV
jgi:hypothetical protein